MILVEVSGDFKYVLADFWGDCTLNSVYCKPLYLHSLNFTSTLGATVACCVSKCHDGVCMAITSIHYFLNFNYSCKSFGYGN